MGLFKKNPPITGGNSYDTKARLDTQIDIDKSNLEPSTYSVSLNSVDTALEELTRFTDGRTLPDYFLLQQQGNYFCNTIKFKCEEYEQMVLKIIRTSFIYGSAGFVCLKGYEKPIPVVKSNSKLDIYGEYEYLELVPIDIYLTSEVSTPNLENVKKIKLHKKDCNLYAEFKWGVMGYSAFLTIFPFIKQQNIILKMLNIDVFSYMKKFVYKTNNPALIKKEMELFFNPLNMFIIDAGVSSGLNNKFKSFSLETKSEQSTLLIEYYKEIKKIYYNIYGRRVNDDDKRERNVTDEVKATQEAYDVLQNEYIAQFKIFTKQAAKLGVNITYEENEENEDNEDKGDKDDSME